MSVFDGLRFRKVYSPIHNLDPRIKFVYVIAIFIVAILFFQIIPLLILFFMQIPFVLLARVQRQWLRSLRGAAFWRHSFSWLTLARLILLQATC